MCDPHALLRVTVPYDEVGVSRLARFFGRSHIGMAFALTVDAIIHGI